MKTISHFALRFLAAGLLSIHNALRGFGSGLFVCRLRLAIGEDDEPEGGDFEGKVLNSLGTMRSEQKKHLDDYSRFTRETKQAFEDLTKVKNHLNSLADFESKLRKVEVLMRQERRMAFGDPAARISADDDLRQRINVAVRLACKNPDVRQLGLDMSKGLSKRSLTDDATPGSTFITPALAREIYDTLAMYGVWNTFAVQPVSTRQTKFPVSTARPIMKAVRKLSGRKMLEDASIAGTSVDGIVELWGVLLGVELELIQDAEYDVTSYVLDNFGEAGALKLDQLCLTANGDDDEDDCGMSGILSTGTVATAAGGNTSIASTDLEDWVNCLTTVDAGVLNRPTRWWINPRNLARAILVRDENGRPLFQTALEAPAYGAVGSILGSPVTPAHAMPSTNGAGDTVAAYGDPRGHVLGLRSDFGFDSSDEFAFDAAKRMFRGLLRAGSKTRKAGAFALLKLPAS